jgi:hypothetical protein
MHALLGTSERIVLHACFAGPYACAHAPASPHCFMLVYRCSAL